MQITKILPIALCFLVLISACGPQQTEDIEEQKEPDSLLIKTTAGLSKLIAKDSLNPLWYARRAAIYAGSEAWDEALKDMQKAMSLDSNNTDFYFQAAELFLSKGEPLRSLMTMDMGIVMDSTHVPFYLEAGRYAYIMKDYQRAINYYNLALERDMQNAKIYFLKGMVYKESGDTNRAISSFQTSTEMDPTNDEAWLQIGLLLQRRDPKMADRYLDNALKADPSNEDALYARAFFLQQKKDYAGAIGKYRELLEVNHRLEKAAYNIGYCYFMMDSLPEAYRYFGMAVSLKPMYKEAYYNKGLVAEALGRKSEAAALFQNALNLDQKYTQAQKALDRVKEHQHE